MFTPKTAAEPTLTPRRLPVQSARVDCCVCPPLHPNYQTSHRFWSSFDTEMCCLSNNVQDYYFVSQGKTTIPNVDDGEECTLTDVRTWQLMPGLRITSQFSLSSLSIISLSALLIVFTSPFCGFFGFPFLVGSFCVYQPPTTSLLSLMVVPFSLE